MKDMKREDPKLVRQPIDGLAAAKTKSAEDNELMLRLMVTEPIKRNYRLNIHRRTANGDWVLTLYSPRESEPRRFVLNGTVGDVLPVLPIDVCDALRAAVANQERIDKT